MADDYNRLAMYAAPVAPVENRLAQAVLPAGHPSNMLMWLRDQIPQVNADDTSTMSGITSRALRTVTGVPRAGLETMSNWLRGTHDPNAVRIGEDTIAPLGLFGMAGMAPRAAAGARAMADNAKSSVPGVVVQGLDMSQEARLGRAREQGFDTSRTWHHGTDAEFDAFQARPAPPYSGGSTVPATWLTSSPRVARAFAEAGGQPGRVIDTHIAAPNLEVVERGFRSPDWETMDPILQRAREAGKDGVMFKRSNDHPDSMVVDPRVWNASDVVAMFNPSNIRSTQAAFDPANAGKNGLLLSDGAKSSVPGTAASASQQPDNAVFDILTKYGLY
jgi:hypothetical protein